MATINNITAKKQEDVSVVDQKILDAETQRNSGTLSPTQLTEINQNIVDFKVQRQEIFDMAFQAADNSPEMNAAMAALIAASTELKTVAGRMTSATAIIANAAAFIGAAGKVVTALGGKP